MENKHENASDFWFWKLPVVGGLGKRAIAVFGAQQAYENISRQIEQEEAQQESVLEATMGMVFPDMLPVQARSLAAIRAKRLLRHIHDEKDDVDARLVSLYGLISDFPEDCSLERLGLDIDEIEQLRIKFKDME